MECIPMLTDPEGPRLAAAITRLTRTLSAPTQFLCRSVSLVGYVDGTMVGKNVSARPSVSHPFFQSGMMSCMDHDEIINDMSMSI